MSYRIPNKETVRAMNENRLVHFENTDALFHDLDSTSAFGGGTVKGLAVGVCLTWFVFAAIGAYCLIMH